ncbi:hypothetical protein [Microbacterium capsulatum]|uniref:Uncharacterized protein n=1 Tax=Microbacterium capsulatum TaxID=3041921 RepID=A0ABU0XBN1_9MICO|nr:hypothetical protein [Microbacterium sp. ASV81]MDQ4212473.1 hypothetical protein [Microbacterium sp. ASV81]
MTVARRLSGLEEMGGSDRSMPFLVILRPLDGAHVARESYWGRDAVERDVPDLDAYLAALPADVPVVIDDLGARDTPE